MVLYSFSIIRNNFVFFVAFLYCNFLGVAFICNADESDDNASSNYINNLSIEDLYQLKIISVSKKEEKPFDAAASIHVVTKEDIISSGATNIPEALKLVPSIQVNKLSTGKWSIGIRGFSDAFSNKLLVLVDGRAVYNPIFSGVYWDVQDSILMDDILRIEVVRGSGSSAWGSNAVNGIINIITKSSEETSGELAGISLSSDNRQMYFRTGEKVSDKFSYRVGFKRLLEDTAEQIEGGYDPKLNRELSSTSFRTDWKLENRPYDQLYLSGNLYQGKADNQLFNTNNGDVETTDDSHGGSLLFNWNIRKNASEGSFLKGYLDYSSRDEYYYDSEIGIFDIEYQNISNAIDNHEITWGLEYRGTWMTVDGKNGASSNPSEVYNNLFMLFASDKIELIGDRLYTIIGAKLENNEYTGIELQPSLKTLFYPSNNKTFWTSLSRTSRVPNYFSEHVSYYPLQPFVYFTSSDQLKSEYMNSAELGFKHELSNKFYYDATVFFNKYTDLAGLEYQITPFGIEYKPQNTSKANVLGFEINSTAQISKKVRISPWYSFIHMELIGQESFVNTEGKTPRHQVGTRIMYNIRPDLLLDTSLAYNSKLKDIQESYDADEYYRIDLNLTWKANKNTTLVAGVHNLLDDKEYGFRHGFNEKGSQFGRRIYTTVKWEF